jgi:predicted nucleic acid-binding Zn ribbon protein
MRGPSVDVLEIVFNRWDDVVGAELARHSRPSAIDGDRLIVTADDPTWASEFRWLENEVIARLTEVTGTDRIAAVSVRVRRRE